MSLRVSWFFICNHFSADTVIEPSNFNHTQKHTHRHRLTHRYKHIHSNRPNTFPYLTAYYKHVYTSNKNNHFRCVHILFFLCACPALMRTVNVLMNFAIINCDINVLLYMWSWELCACYTCVCVCLFSVYTKCESQIYISIWLFVFLLILLLLFHVFDLFIHVNKLVQLKGERASYRTEMFRSENYWNAI